MTVVERVTINDKEYIFIKDFKDNVLLRKSYNALTQKTYGFDFEQWYQGGYWGNSYVPYSLMDGENIVANVSISIIDFMVLGESKRYIQIGTVMTDPAYRNQGLSRYLMDRIIAEWKDKCHMLYLFANDSVLDFYPKFGFVTTMEYQYSKNIEKANEFIAAEKLDMSLNHNRELVVKKIKSSIAISKLSMLKNVGLVMFYCISFMSNNIYYLREEDVIAIAEFQGDTLYLHDIFSSSEVNLDDIIKALTNKEVKKLLLGFTPKDTDSYSVDLLNEDNTTLFIMEGKENLFKDNKVMFPVLSHA